MNRRAFISLLGGASLALPGLWRAQERTWRIVALIAYTQDKLRPNAGSQHSMTAEARLG